MSERWRLWATGVAVVMTAAVLWPIVPDEDGFPLSNYPMFSLPKKTRAKVFHVVGFTPQGLGRPLSPEMVGTDEIMQAYQTVKLAIVGGRGASLCKEAAARVRDSEDFEDITRLEVRIDVFDAVRYWQGDRSTENSRVVAHCEVIR